MPNAAKNKAITLNDSSYELTIDAFLKGQNPMVPTCPLLYGRTLKFGGEFWLHYPIDKTKVPILYKLKLVNRC
jgi:hypothetical protein